jgi:hypothetical protein
MPLHDWFDTPGWEGVHLFWMSELARHLKGKLPPGFRAYLGSGPAVSIGTQPARPDVAVRTAPQATAAADPAADIARGNSSEPELEIAVAALEPAPSLFVERDHRLVAAVELISPRNKDRPAARASYAARYAGYLIDGVHLMLVDVHPRPVGFSFADAINTEFQITDQPPLPPPFAAVYRVGEPAATGGKMLGLWRRALSSGAPLPTLPLPLDVHTSVPVDLETTYMRAAADAYLA